MFVGVDMSPYAVAKSSVIYEMLKDDEIEIESILEVWFSSTWTKGTLEDFRKAVTTAMEICNDRKIFAYLKHWQSFKGVTLKKARAQWFSSITIPGSDVAVLKKIDDILDMSEYFLSGDVHARINAVPVCGNITMFDNIRSCPKRSKDESIFHVLDMNSKEFVSCWCQTRSLKECVVKVLFDDIQKIKQRIVSGVVQVKLICGEVVQSNTSIIERLRAMKPSSISWSNCIDFIDHRVFHKMARKIGTQDCVHFAYSLNWMYAVHGSNIIDYEKLENREKIMEGSKYIIEECWKHSGLDKVMIFPPIDNAINFGSIAVRDTLTKEWVRFFLSPGIVGADVDYNESDV